MTYTPVPERDMDFEWARELMVRRFERGDASRLILSENEGFALDYMSRLYNPRLAPANEAAFRRFLLLRAWSRDDTAISIREDWVGWVKWAAGKPRGDR